MRGDDVYDASGFGKVVDVDSVGRQQPQFFPALIAPRQHPSSASAAAVGRSPSYYGGAGCPHGLACPVHQDGGSVWDGGHDCCATIAAGRRLEHVYETAAGGFTTRCRVPVITSVDETYLPPGQTQTDASSDQLFDAGRV